MPKATPAQEQITTVFTWGIANLERETKDGYVYTVHYTVSANDGTYSSSAYGSLGFERPEILIPYADLTESICMKWVKDALGEEKVQSILDALQVQLDEQRSPSKAAGLPWTS